MHLRLTPMFLGSAVLIALASGCRAAGPDVDLVPPTPSAPPEGDNFLVPRDVQSAPGLPAISGGTLLVTSSNVAVVSDPDHDTVYTVPLRNLGDASTLTLSGHDEPGRAVEGPNGMAYIVLRRAGQILALDLASHSVVQRFNVCPAPRGIAWDPSAELLRVACAGGELVSFNPGLSDGPMRTVKVDDDLRDVVITRNGFSVTRFRSAEVLEFNPDVTLRRRVSLRTVNRETRQAQGVGVAWRAVATPDGGIAVVHQRMLTLAELNASSSVHGSEPTPTPVPTGSLHYGASGSVGPLNDSPSCKPGLVQSVVTIVPPDGPAMDFPPLVMAPLPVDIAWLSDGPYVAVAGFAVNQGGGLRHVSPNDINTRPECSGQRVQGINTESGGQVIAVAQSTEGVVALTRNPLALHLPGRDIMINPLRTIDTGHAVFHAATSAGLACASCHPEGGDDGHVWRFTNDLPRRTQSLHGGVAGTFPLHWEGDMQDFSHLMDEVFVRRMGGSPLLPGHAAALERWVNSVPVPASASSDSVALDAVARGQRLFNSPTVGCATCHAGERFTNNATVDVGSGEALQVPALTGLRWRAPFMHNGCAPTLRDRFTNPACGGGDRHGVTSQLSPADIDDLIAFLQSI